MSYDPVSLGIQWDRLISISDEIVNSLVRTSFSTNVRESYDLSCVMFDARGRSIAQGTYSVPSFTGTAPVTLRHLLQRFPAETLGPGDVIATNDPWMGTGHLWDINVVQPVFHRGHLVGYTMSVTHLPDIGGAGYGTNARTIYEEGLRLPPCKLVRAGEVDPMLIEIIASNVRVPEQTVGDVMANIACTTVGARMLGEFLDEYRLESLDEVAAAILDFSEAAMRKAIAAIPEGVYENAIDIESHDTPLRLACQIAVRDGAVQARFDGTSGAVASGINVPLCYTRAMACYAIKCLTTPSIPNNEGSVQPVDVDAPVGSVLNAIAPSPTGGRHVIGHFVVPLIFGALAKVLPDRVQADSGMLNLMNMQSRTASGQDFSNIYFASGGLGAMAGCDGWSATPGPSNMIGTAVEVWEDLTGTHILRKELRTDSGGAGEFRGGLGQLIEIRNDNAAPLSLSCMAGRNEFPPLGLLGGEPGQLREVLVNGRKVHPKGRYSLATGDVLTSLEAGGGGYGDKRDRRPEAVLADVANGLVSAEKASQDYGIERSA